MKIKWFRALFTMHTMHKGENAKLHKHLIFVNYTCIGLNMIKKWISIAYISLSLTVFSQEQHITFSDLKIFHTFFSQIFLSNFSLHFFNQFTFPCLIHHLEASLIKIEGRSKRILALWSSSKLEAHQWWKQNFVESRTIGPRDLFQSTLQAC